MAFASVIGRRIRQRRRELGLSQEALAEKLDVSHQQIHKYENGRTSITVTRLYDFSVHLQTSIDFFLKGTKPSESVQGASDRPSARERQLVKLYRAIDDFSIQAALFQLVKRLGQRKIRPAGVYRTT